MKINRLFVFCAALLMGIMLQSCSCGEATTIAGDNYKLEDGMIHFVEPARAAGQQSMLGFAADPAVRYR